MNFPAYPAAFNSKQPPPRIGGGEIEYIVADARAGSLSDAWEGGFFRPDVLAAADQQGFGHWRKNGGKLHRDGSLAEYAGPECLSARSTTASLRASNVIIQDLRAASGNEHLVFYRRSATVQATSGRTFTYGNHLNHIIPEYVADAGLLQLLESHHATQTFASGGIVTPNGFNIAPKSLGIGTRTTVSMGDRIREGGKPFAILRQADDNDTNHPDHGFARYENRTWTPSTEWSDFMASVTTSLLLRIIEHQRTLREEFRELCDLQLKNPVETFRSVGADMAGKESYGLLEGGKITGLGMQCSLSRLAISACEKLDLPDEEMFGALEWHTINKDTAAYQRGDLPLEAIADRVGWAQKYHTLKEKYGSEITDTARGLGRCLMWDSIAPEGPGLKIDALKGKRILTDAAIEQLVTNPPEGTRANIRGRIVQANVAGRLDINEMGWTSVGVRGGSYLPRLALHPYQTELTDRQKAACNNAV